MCSDTGKHSGAGMNTGAAEGAYMDAGIVRDRNR